MTIKQNLNQIQQIITQAAIESGRNSGDVLLLAVSKQQSIEAITDAYKLGLTHFGENYFQEALQKINALKNLPLHWHFIGPIQGNKTKGIATNFSWVHSIDRLKIAKQLNDHRPTDLAPLNVCLQINLVNEATKSGVAPEEATELALAVSQLPRLKLRGLMIIPPPEHGPALFKELNQLMQQLNQELKLNMDTLSMGMSDDLFPAIQAGATIVRIGRALFGARS